MCYFTSYLKTVNLIRKLKLLVQRFSLIAGSAELVDTHTHTHTCAGECVNLVIDPADIGRSVEG